MIDGFLFRLIEREYLFMAQINFEGILIGITTFLIIGLFHPVVVKSEYYWGTKSWWIFLCLGIASFIASLLISETLLSVVFGVLSFSSFWTIKEIFEQQERVLKGWFPKNPKRVYPDDIAKTKEESKDKK